jgi:hypothetical protein
MIFETLFNEYPPDIFFDYFERYNNQLFGYTCDYIYIRFNSEEILLAYNNNSYFKYVLLTEKIV